MRSGELDITHVFQGEIVSDLRDNPGELELLEDSGSGAETVHVLVNNADGVMSDLEIRRALAQATNAELVNEAVGGGISEVANGPFPPGDTGHVEDNGYPEYDPEAARQAVEEYEAANGPLALSLKTTSDDFNLSATELIADQWEQAGIDVSIDQVEQVQFVLDAAQGRFQAVTFRSLPHSDPDQLNYQLSSQTSAPIGGLGINFGRVEDPEVDAALDTIRESGEPGAREEAAVALNRRLAEQVLLLPLFWVIWALPTRPSTRSPPATAPPTASPSSASAPASTNSARSGSTSNRTVLDTTSVGIRWLTCRVGLGGVMVSVAAPAVPGGDGAVGPEAVTLDGQLGWSGHGIEPCARAKPLRTPRSRRATSGRRSWKMRNIWAVHSPPRTATSRSMTASSGRRDSPQPQLPRHFPGGEVPDRGHLGGRRGPRRIADSGRRGPRRVKAARGPDPGSGCRWRAPPRRAAGARSGARASNADGWGRRSRGPIRSIRPAAAGSRRASSRLPVR